jgi:hypothetical protein
MYVIDGIAYAGKQQTDPDVIMARPLADYKLLLRFSTGEKKIFDMAPLLQWPCYSRLRDKANFDSVYVDGGIPTWFDGEIDIAPETVYTDSVPQKAEAGVLNNPQPGEPPKSAYYSGART